MDGSSPGGAAHDRLTFEPGALAIRTLFPTPVAVAPVEAAAASWLNEALAATILARAAAVPGVLRSNAGGWQSDDDLLSWTGAPGAFLLDGMRLLANHLTVVQTNDGLSRVPPAWRINAWANVNRAGHANLPHHHPGAFWSGVYWVDAGEASAGDGPLGGEFEMQDPRGILPSFYAPTLRYAVAGCLSAGLSDFLEPRTGTMVLFPSWLVHGVKPFQGTRPRISVACNFAV